MTTEPRGPGNKNFPSKIRHPFATKGTEEGKKRRRTSGEVSINKKGRILESDLSEDSEEEIGSSRSSSNLDVSIPGSPKMDTNNPECSTSKSSNPALAAEVIKVLGDPAVIEHLSKAFAKQIVQDLKSKIEDVEKKGAETAAKLTQIDRRLDEVEQRHRECNAIVTGLQGSTSKEEVSRVLNEKLKCNTTSSDIVYILKLPGRAGQQNGHSSVRVAFSSVESKMKVMRAKKKLNRDDQFWISDDLTTYRSGLAYKARQCIKRGEAHSTWVAAGRVYIKLTEKSTPIRVRAEDDIPRPGPARARSEHTETEEEN
jgi:hypothetical protein